MKVSKIFLTAFAAAAVLLTAACSKDGVKDDGGGPAGGGTPYDLTGLTVDGQFPIIAWTGINWNETHKFRAMKDCGINTYLGWYDNLMNVLSVLDAAEQYGVKLIIRSESFNSDTQAEVSQMMGHPALLMYHIHDEPSENDFGWIAEVVNNIRKVDATTPWYVNLYPNWAWGGAGSYRSRLVSYCNAMPELRFLSFDNYPIRNIGLREDWYRNLEDIRYIARSKKVPFWAFALALAHTTDEAHYPIPTVAELRLQQFSNLAYGAQGFQYFTYWGIYQNGPTQVYERVQTVNKELQALSKYFLGADVTDVWHTGAVIPDGTVKLSSMPSGVESLVTSDGGAVVSHFTKDGVRYLALVNKDYQNEMSLDIDFSNSVRQLDKEGYYAQASSGNYTVGPGDIILFQLN
ncbi:MAG: beta-galactosidase [Bacteroidales bacterium]|nr:beta-galactosidase [Bacteroidales bacterium]